MYKYYWSIFFITWFFVAICESASIFRQKRQTGTLPNSPEILQPDGIYQTYSLNQVGLPGINQLSPLGPGVLGFGFQNLNNYFGLSGNQRSENSGLPGGYLQAYKSPIAVNFGMINQPQNNVYGMSDEQVRYFLTQALLNLSGAGNNQQQQQTANTQQGAQQQSQTNFNPPEKTPSGGNWVKNPSLLSG